MCFKKNRKVINIDADYMMFHWDDLKKEDLKTALPKKQSKTGKERDETLQESIAFPAIVTQGETPSSMPASLIKDVRNSVKHATEKGI